MRAATINDVTAYTDCELCHEKIGTCVTELGETVINDHVVALDGITQKVVTFHKTCHVKALAGTVAADPDLQRHHRTVLGGKRLGLTGMGIA